MNIFRKLFGKRKKEVETIEEVNQEVSTPESSVSPVVPEPEITYEPQEVRSKNISFNPKYLVLEDGNVFSTKSNKFLTPAKNGGNLYVNVKHPKRKGRTFRLDKLIYCEFNEMDVIDTKIKIIHKDGNNLNCSLDNLKVKS